MFNVYLVSFFYLIIIILIIIYMYVGRRPRRSPLCLKQPRVDKSNTEFREDDVKMIAPKC